MFRALNAELNASLIGRSLLSSKAPGAAAYNLDIVGLKIALIIEREFNIRKVERPYIIAVAIVMQMAL